MRELTLGMAIPTCTGCGTDRYLKYLDFQPATTEELRLPAAGGITRSRRVEPVVQFFCRKCGYFNGYSVDFDWTPPTEDPVSERELRSLGSYWEAPNKKVTVTNDGGTITTFGG